jgi:hypothetical protein
MLVLPVGLAFAWTSFSGYQGLNGQDAHDYLRIARAWTGWFNGGPRPIMVEHPHGFPLAGALLGNAMGSELWALRLLSATALVVVLLAFRKVLRQAFPHDAPVNAFLLTALATAPFLLRYSLVVMSDVPAIALLGVSFLCTYRWVVGQRLIFLFSAAVFSLLALSVRLAAAPIVLLLALAWVHGGPKGRRARWVAAGSLLMLGLLSLAIFPPTGQLATLVSRLPLGDWSVVHILHRDLVSDDGILHYQVPNILYVIGIAVHPGFIPMGVLLLPFVRRGDLQPIHARLALMLAMGYLLFIAGMPYQNDRVLLMAQPFVVLLFFPAFRRAVAYVRTKGLRPSWAIAGLATVQMALFVRAMLPFMHQAQVERELADHVNALHPRHVYTHGMGAAFADYCPNVVVTELWYGAIEHFDHGALVVVRPANLAAQWPGTPPAVNWQRARDQGVIELGRYPDGWVVARVR